MLTIAIVGGSAVASGDTGGPVPPLPVNGDNLPVDTFLTPSPNQKPVTDLWKQVAGARFGDTKAPSTSATSYADYLYAVTNPDPDHAFAGGSEKIDCPSGPELVPVIYRYEPPSSLTPGWHQSYLGSCDSAGYVGGITELGDGTGRFLAVGGSGCYPAREQPCPDGLGPQTGDPAGHGRAWEYDPASQQWSELDLSRQVAGGMGGLSAVAFNEHPRTRDQAIGFAGGLGQLWPWSGGHFASSPIDSTSPSSEIRNGADFVYRVRQIRVLYGGFDGQSVEALAVTSGCCAQPLPGGIPDTAQDTPRLLAFDGTKWYVNAFGFDATNFNNDNEPIITGTPVSQRPDLPDSLYALLPELFPGVGPGNDDYSISVLASAGGPETATEPSSRISDRICVDPSGYHPTGMVGYAISEAFGASPFINEAGNVIKENPSSARLVDADGDGSPVTSGIDLSALGASSLGSPAGGVNTDGGADGCSQPPNGGLPDWAVGELRSSGQGLLLANELVQGLIPGTVNTNPDTSNPLGYQPTSKQQITDEIASAYLLTSSYALNAISVDPQTEADGFAVGDHGAILQYTAGGGTEQNQPPPPAPKLGSPGVDSFASAGGYAAFTAQPALPGTVPSLEQEPAIHRTSGQLEPGGSPDPFFPTPNTALVQDVGQIVMSRDGTEGWAIGPNYKTKQEDYSAITTMYHYIDGHWSACDGSGVFGQVPADPACSEVLPILQHDTDSGDSGHPGVRLVAVARVPTENSNDPSRANAFELVAIGDSYDGVRLRHGDAIAILDYRNGRWQFEPTSERAAVASPAASDTGTSNLNQDSPTGIAFTSPSDGWILGNPRGDYPLWHFDGQHWIACTPGTAACFDPAGLTAFTGGAPGLTDLASGELDTVDITSAGRHVYLYGTRTFGNTANSTSYPLILERDSDQPCQKAGDAGCWHAVLDPGCLSRSSGSCQSSGNSSDQGTVRSLAVGEQDGTYAGWAVGQFGFPGGGTTSLLRLSADGAWKPVPDTGPIHDYLSGTGLPNDQTALGDFDPRPADLVTDHFHQLTTFGPGGELDAIAQLWTGRIFVRDPTRGVWRVLISDRPPGSTPGIDGGVDGPVQAIAADGQGGFWVAARVTDEHYWWTQGVPVYFFHFTAHPHKPVFTEVPNPAPDDSAVFTSMAGAPDGAVLLGTDSGELYHYNRILGWDQLRIGGWQPGALATSAQPVNAVALNPSGQGLAVGQSGRIADVARLATQLDPAAGLATTYDLDAAAVAPDGSALAGGDHATLLWRPARGTFHAVSNLPVAPSTSITGLTMPLNNQAWLTTRSGLIVGGTLTGESWTWKIENKLASGQILGQDAGGHPLPLRAIAVDANRHGFAVGDDGLILERSAAGGWTRLITGFQDNLTSVALPAGGGPGALVGGHNGLVLTWQQGEFQMARPADYSGGDYYEMTGPVVGLALVPGSRLGQVEAWAALQGSDTTHDRLDQNGVNQLLHYSSDPADPSLDADTGRVRPLPDTPAPRPGELTLDAFGGGCQRLDGNGPVALCNEMEGTTADYDVYARRIIQAITSGTASGGRPVMTIFTGDAIDSATTPAASKTSPVTGPQYAVTTGGPVKFARWNEFVARPLLDAGIPLFGAVGSRDLSEPEGCDPGQPPPLTTCTASGHNLRVGDNVAWRDAFASMPAPWGSGAAPTSSTGDSFVPVPNSGTEAPTLSTQAGTASADGAHTHYALDIVKNTQPRLRLVFVDSSLRSVTGTEALENPIEDQLTWLQSVLCEPGEETSSSQHCTRQAGEPAVVVSETPDFSYGPGSGNDTLTDAPQFEAVLFKYHVNLVVSGRVGWNGLYYATAPGVYEPCAGGSYPTHPPAAGTATPCSATGGAGGSAESQLSTALAGAGAPPPPVDPTGAVSSAGVTGLIPFVIADSATSGFGSDGTANGSAGQGFWHGYTVIRLSPDGDPYKTIVEQRPIFDWIGLGAIAHDLQPGQHLQLHGFGREPIVQPVEPQPMADHIDQTVRVDAIDSPAITHRYDLVEADPSRPWLPKIDASGNYIPLDPSVATVNQQTGFVQTGSGSHPRVYAIGILSVGDQASSWPLVFEPRRSFVQRTPILPQLPPLAPPLQVPAAHLAAAAPAPPPPPSSTPPSPPEVGTPSLPQLPSLSPPPPVAAVTPPAPPPPPAPPTPPSQPAPLPLALQAKLSPVGINATVVPPSPPPVNPAPPSGSAARKEAKQRQAATAKSEEGDARASDETMALGGDQAPSGLGPPGSAMTRHTPDGGGRHAFTAVTARHQPSAWSRDLLYGGGLAGAALILALGFTLVRPGPRRREPRIPAPAWARRTKP